MGITVNPTSYSFKVNEEIVIRYSGDYVSEAFLYGVGGASVRSLSTTQDTVTFPGHSTSGTYNCYFGTYIDNVWTKTNTFIVTITDDTPTNIPVTGVSISPSSKQIYVGDTTTLVANISPSDATNKNVTWSSLSSQIAVVSQSGVVTGVREGSATIRVVTEDGNKHSDAMIQVLAKESETILVESISLNKTSHTFSSINSIVTLSPTISPDNATNKSVTWSSTNNSVATVVSGVVTSKGEGTATIRCSSTDGSNKSATCFITVSLSPEIVPVQSVTVSPSSKTLRVGETLQLTTTVLPNNATDKSVVYASDRTSVASVNSSGLITAKGVGSAVVSATSVYDSNKKSNCIITVEATPSENNPPKIGAVLVSGEDYDGSYTLIYNASDLDNDVLTHKLKIDDNNYVAISPSQDGTKYTYKGRGLSIGTHECYIQVSDGKIATTSSKFTITIKARPTSIKAELKDVKDLYDSKFLSLKDTINQIISDGKFDEGEKALLDLARNEYNTSFAKFGEVSHKALNSIGDKKLVDAKKEIDKEIADINASLDGLDGLLDGAFADGILDDAEKISIKGHIEILGNEKADVDKQYKTLYENVDLVGNDKVSLKTSYDNYVLKYNRLISTINDILNKTSNIDETDRTKLSDAFSELRTAIGDYRVQTSNAIDSIAKKKADDSAEVVNKKYAEIILDAENGIVSKVGRLENTTEGLKESVSSIDQKADGIISTVKTVEEGLKDAESKITQTATEIRSEVKDVQNGLQASINLNTTSISQKVSNGTFESYKTQTADLIASKVGSDNIGSLIQQNPNSIKIGFNQISDSVEIDSNSMKFKDSAGNKSIALHRGNLYLYEPNSSVFMGAGVISRWNSGLYNAGTGILASDNSYYFSVAKANGWSSDAQLLPPMPTEYMVVNYRDRGSALTHKIGTHIYHGLYAHDGMNLMSKDITNVNKVSSVYIQSSDYTGSDGTKLFSNVGTTMTNNVNWDWKDKNLLNAKIQYATLSNCTFSGSLSVSSLSSTGSVSASSFSTNGNTSCSQLLSNGGVRCDSYRDYNNYEMFQTWGNGGNMNNKRNWDWGRKNLFNANMGYAIQPSTRDYKEINLDGILDSINIYPSVTTLEIDSNRSLEIDVTELKQNDNSDLFIKKHETINENGETEIVENIDMKSMLHLALLEIKNLKEEVRMLKENK